jgi:hypothetical protein
MKNPTMSHLEAWQHFEKNFIETGTIKPIPHELRSVQYDYREGRILGPKRVKKMLEKYAPGAYEWSETVTFLEK